MTVEMSATPEVEHWKKAERSIASFLVNRLYAQHAKEPQGRTNKIY